MGMLAEQRAITDRNSADQGGERKEGGEMWWLKTCPRCGGDVFAEPGRRSWAEECLQCGYAREYETALVAEVAVKGSSRL